MNAVIDFLAEHGPMLLAGVTALLGAACAAVWATRSPAHRQRLTEAGVCACALWVVLACVPMQRWRWPAPAQDPADQNLRQVMPSDLRYDDRPVEIPPELLVGAEVGPTRQNSLDHPGESEDGQVARNTLVWMQWPAPVARRQVDWPRVGAMVFVSGSAVTVLWLALGHVLVWRMLRRSAAAPAWVSATVREVLPEGAIEPHVKVVAHLARPASLGVWRPVILLPHSLMHEGSTARVRQVILHELGHVMRRDGLGNALFNLAMPLLWFHPLYWWLRSQASLSRERVADDWAAGF